MRRALALCAILLVLGACGRVGPPVRRRTPPATPPPEAPLPVEDEDEDPN